MKTRNPWLLGLQWGACAWLGFVSLRMCLFLAYSCLWPYLGPSLERGLARAMGGGYGLPSDAAWVVALVLVAAGSRWSRAAVAVAIAGQCAVGLWFGLGNDHSARLALRAFVPMCVPMLPLVVLRVEEPRVVLALLALGRWREAWARSGGVRAAVVALGVVSLNHPLFELF